MFQKISLGKNTTRDFDLSSKLEWLEVNGLGGYASSTVSGANTRKYHGLLVAAVKEQLDRKVLLSKLEGKLSVGDESYELGCNQYPGVVYPSGYQLLDSFCLDPFPTYRYSAGRVVLEKELFAVHGANRTVINYRLISAPSEVELEIRPLVCERNFHEVHRRNMNFDPHVYSVLGGIMMMPYDEDSKLYLVASGGDFQKEGYWYKNFEYLQEMSRGLDFREDLFSPGFFIVKLQQGDEFSIVASTDYPHYFDPSMAREEEIRRRRGTVENSFVAEKAEKLAAPFSNDFIRSLLLASDSFLLRKSSKSYGLIAGYHWFSEWGRDTMISLPGLTLVTGRFNEAAELIKTWLSYMDGGLIPNAILENGSDSIYNSVDAALWMFNAVYLYLKYTNDLELIREIYPKLREVLKCYTEGTRYNIYVDAEDGLLMQGEPSVQLTWMDAKVGDWVVTPRHGKAVEINGLWYNALMVMAKFAQIIDERADRAKYFKMAKKVERNFMHTFWNKESQCLFDCISEKKADASIRPNQAIAIGLPFSPLPREAACVVLEVVERELLTPYGLRTLSPKDTSYSGIYQGDQFSRDGAYHQGTVWPWLLGPFISAYSRCHKDEPGYREKILSFLDAFPDHIHSACLGTISEIFDGDHPHHAKGCISQAWSVAEVLRVLLENKFI